MPGAHWKPVARRPLRRVSRIGTQALDTIGQFSKMGFRTRDRVSNEACL
jgi:hypothetical protein